MWASHYTQWVVFSKKKKNRKDRMEMCWWAEGELDVLREWMCSRHFIYMYQLVKGYIKYLNIY